MMKLSREELLEKIMKHYRKRFEGGEMTEFIFETCKCCFYSMPRKQLLRIYNEEVK
jgi:hypothetical protein